MYKLNIITVNFETDEFVKSVYKSLKLIGDVNKKFIIVDNSNTLKNNDFLSDGMPGLETILVKNNCQNKNPNQHHLSGLNLGLKNINKDFEYTLIIDPDIAFTEGTIQKIISNMEHQNLDILGVNKFYQWHKILETIKYPYIYFTIIKTKHLINFKFSYLPKIIRKYINKKWDTGDSIYNLVKKKKLSYRTIDSFPKQQQSEIYPYKNIKTDDWIDIKNDFIISHFRSGSIKRATMTHNDDSRNDFIKNSQNFVFENDFSFLKINFGAGKKIRNDLINQDYYKLKDIDLEFDLNMFPYPLKDSSVCYALFDNVIEHLDNISLVLKELKRIMTNDGIIEIFVPYAKSSGAFQDPTHKHFFTEETFKYFEKDSHLNYYIGAEIEILKNQLIIRKTGGKITLIRKLIPFKKLANVFLWNVYDTLYTKIKIRK